MISTRKICEFLKSIDQYVSDNGLETKVSAADALTTECATAICWCKKKVSGSLFCAALIVGPDYEGVSENTVVIVTKNPKYAFLKVINRFFLKDTPMYRIDPSATISEDVNIMGPVSIGQNVVILGAGEIGEGTIIHPNVTMRGPFKIGKNVEIHPGCVVGYDGFGYGKTPQSEYEKFPHLGQVIIEDDVEIGANSCIDRGILTDTIIGHHTKIDKACLIAHGVIIGRSCMVAGFTNIGGSVVVGDYVWLSPKATILNGISIGHHATVGIGSVVLRSVKAGETVFGNPAKVIKRAVAS